MDNFLNYINSNPLGAAVLCAAGAIFIGTLSALVAALRGGAGRIFGEYQALGRSISNGQKIQRQHDADYTELHNRVSELGQPAQETDKDQLTTRRTD